MHVEITKDVVHLLSHKKKGGVLHLNDPVGVVESETIRHVLVSKHTLAHSVRHDTLIHRDDLNGMDTFLSHRVLLTLSKSTLLHYSHMG